MTWMVSMVTVAVKFTGGLDPVGPVEPLDGRGVSPTFDDSNRAMTSSTVARSSHMPAMQVLHNQPLVGREQGHSLMGVPLG
jgi:hypothetical protein